MVQQLLRLEQPLDLGLAVHDLPLGSNLKFGIGEHEKLVAPEFQRLLRLEQFFVNLSKQPVTRHKQRPPPLMQQLRGQIYRQIT